MPPIRPRIRQAFSLAVRRTVTLPAEVDEEIALHLELRSKQLQSAGLTPDEARAEALRRFGPTAHARNDLRAAARQRDRSMNVKEQLSSFAADVRYAARGLARDRWFTAFVAITLGLGIGVNAAMYGVVDRLLLRGPEYVRDANRVQRLYMTAQSPGMSAFTTGTLGYVSYDVLRRNAKSVQVAAYAISQEAITFGTGVTAERWSLGQATADLFPLLGATPLLGRFFTADEDRTTGADHVLVLVLGYSVWKRAFNSDSAIVGKTISLSGETYSIVGVARNGFTGPELEPVNVWLPMSLRSKSVTDNWTAAWNAQWLQVVGRLAPGATPKQASAEATVVLRNAYTGTDKAISTASFTFSPLSFTDDGVEPPEIRVSKWLIGVCAIVLIVACANVANLLLTRIVRRHREVAVRLALGAGSGRLMRMFLVESVLLSAIGSIAAVSVAYGAGAFMRVVLLPSVEWTSSPVNGRILFVALSIALVVGLLIGALPAWRASRPGLMAGLKSGIREGGGQQSRVRTILTVTQAALSAMLLVGAGLFLQSLAKVRSLDLGIQPERVVVVAMRWPAMPGGSDQAQRTQESDRRKGVFPLMLQRIRAMPDVEYASLTVGLPFRSSFGQRLRVAGFDSLPRLKGGSPQISAITNDYFETTGARMIAGRAFTENDRKGSEPVAIVSQTMARTLWPNSSPLGTCLYSGDSTAACSRIVGVVSDVRRFRLTEDPAMHYYLPFGQEIGMGGTSLLLRPRAKLSTIVAEVRKAANEIDPTITYVDAKLLQNDVDPQIRPWRLGANVFALMGVLALFVAAVGLYSVMSYVVAQRRHEMGIRVALGATASNILRLVLRSGLLMTAGGVAVGIGVSALGGRFIQPLLFQTSATDSRVFVVVFVTLMVVALLSCFVPALRAQRVNPIEALRTE